MPMTFRRVRVSDVEERKKVNRGKIVIYQLSLCVVPDSHQIGHRSVPRPSLSTKKVSILTDRNAGEREPLLCGCKLSMAMRGGVQ